MGARPLNGETGMSKFASECVGVATWEIAGYLERLMDDGKGWLLAEIAQRTKLLWPDDPIDVTTLSKVLNFRTCKTPPVKGLHYADRLCIATGSPLAITFKVVCRPTAAAARSAAKEEFAARDELPTPHELARRSAELLDESRRRVALGDPRHPLEAASSPECRVLAYG